jgi:hypothetical protein
VKRTSGGKTGLALLPPPNRLFKPETSEPIPRNPLKLPPRALTIPPDAVCLSRFAIKLPLLLVVVPELEGEPKLMLLCVIVEVKLSARVSPGLTNLMFPPESEPSLLLIRLAAGAILPLLFDRDTVLTSPDKLDFAIFFFHLPLAF